MSAHLEPTQSQGEPLDTAEELLLDALADDQRDARAALEELCVAHADLADVLRARFAEYMALRSTLRTLRPRSANDPRPLQLVFGRFQLLAELGRGGMSVVLLAWDQKLRRKVALKCVLQPDGAQHSTPTQIERRRARLTNEAQVLAQLDHPGIVPVYDVVRDEHGEIYVVMLRVRGVDLREVYQLCWRKEREWSVARVVAVLQRVCEAVAYAHEKEVLHRDLKPANVMVGAFGETYVMDWGLARTRGARAGVSKARRKTKASVVMPNGPVDGSLSVVVTDRDESASDSSAALYTQEGDVVGTPSYMPPEQAAGAGELDGRADVYALGAMLYELLAMQSPYTRRAGSDSPAQMLDALRSGPPRALGEVAPRAPAELTAIVERAMARDPDQRYATMRELADELRAFLEGRVVRAHRTGAAAELRKWVRRNPLAAGGAALAAAAVLAAAGLQFANHRRLASVNAELIARDYRNSVALAAAALRGGDVRESRRLLDRTEPTQRGWEWHHLSNELESSSFILAGHGPRVCALAISSDERWLAAGDQRGVVTLWDLDTRTRAAESEGELGALMSLEFSADGERLVATNLTDAVVLLDARTLVPIGSGPLVLPNGSAAGPLGHDLAVSRSGELLASNIAGAIGAWSIGQPSVARVFTGRLFHQTFVSYQPACDRIAAGSASGQAAVWDCASGTRVALVGSSNARVDGVALLPDGRSLVTGDWRGRLELWNMESGELVRTIDTLPRPVYRMRWHPDASLLTVAAGCSLHLYDSRTWGSIGHLRGHREIIANFVYSSQGRWLASADMLGEVRVWDRATLNRRTVRRASVQLRDVALDSHTGELVTVGDLGDVEVWDLSTQALVSCFRTTRSIRDVGMAIGGSWLVITDTAGDARVYDVRSGACLHVDLARGWRFREAEVLRAARALLVSRGDGGVERIDMDTRELVWTSAPLEGGVSRMEMSEDGSWLVVCNGHGQLGVIDVANGALRSWRPCQDRLTRAYLDRDVARILIRKHSGDVALFDLAREALVWVAPMTGNGDCAFSADETRVFATGNGGDLIVLDAATGESIVALPGNDAADERVLVSRGGERVVTLGTDDDLRVWYADPQR